MSRREGFLIAGHGLFPPVRWNLKFMRSDRGDVEPSIPAPAGDLAVFEQVDFHEGSIPALCGCERTTPFHQGILP